MENVTFAIPTDLIIEGEAAIRTALIAFMTADASSITLDLGTVKRMDATGVALLLSAMKSCHEKGVRFGLTQVPLSIATVLTAIGADRYLEITSDNEPETRKTAIIPGSTQGRGP